MFIVSYALQFSIAKRSELIISLRSPQNPQFEIRRFRGMFTDAWAVKLSTVEFLTCDMPCLSPMAMIHQDFSKCWRNSRRLKS